MSELAVAVLSRDEARSLTDEVKQDAERLWRKVQELRDGQAHLALGYPSWRSYWAAEFGGDGSRGDQLARAGEVLEALGDNCPLPRNEAQARELVPLRDDPEQLRDAWAEVVELHPEPTAADVRDVVQRRMDVHYSSATPEWGTPQPLFDVLHREFAFELDVCANAENAKCATFFDRELDGLAQPWTGVCWMNPPYGDEIVKWVRKAYESAREGATVVCLVPARVDTGWWWDYCRHGQVRFLRGRLKFGGADTGAPFPSAVVVFGRAADTIYWERAA